jgi:hypothetical protein
MGSQSASLCKRSRLSKGCRVHPCALGQQRLRVAEHQAQRAIPAPRMRLPPFRQMALDHGQEII